jgi:hypothetical protein
MALAVEEEEAPDPWDVGAFRPNAVMPDPNAIAQPIQPLRHLRLGP